MRKYGGRIDIHPVGVLRTWLNIRNALTHPELVGLRWGIVRQNLVTQSKWTLKHIRQGNWRALRNQFNGYLCEHETCQHGPGSGWSRNKAIWQADKVCRDSRRSWRR